MNDSRPASHNPPEPDITAKIFFVEFGYQIDIKNRLTGMSHSICRDFGGSYVPIEWIADQAADALVDLMRTFDKEYLDGKGHDKPFAKED